MAVEMAVNGQGKAVERRWLADDLRGELADESRLVLEGTTAGP